MTRDEAIAIRQDQLSGKSVNPFRFAEALNIIATADRAPNESCKRVHPKGKPMEVLRRLTSGPVDRGELYGEFNQGRASEAIRRLQSAGLIRCEVKLTEAGLRALGLVGPRV